MYNGRLTGQKRGEREGASGRKLCSGGALARGSREGSEMQASPGALTQLFLFVFYQCFSSKEKGRREDTSRTREERGGMEEGDVAERKEKQQRRKGREAGAEKGRREDDGLVKLYFHFVGFSLWCCNFLFLVLCFHFSGFIFSFWYFRFTLVLLFV